MSGTVQTPRHPIISNHTVVSHTLATDAPVGHTEPCPVSLPPYFPVTVASQALLKQDFSPVVEPVGVIRIVLLLCALGNFSVVLREDEKFVSCIRIQFKVTCVWKKGKNVKLKLTLTH